MHRNNLISLLKSYKPLPEEQIHHAQILQFINENPQCFERTLEEGHITASAWLVNKDNSQALLMHHAKLGIWVQLGGHCDGNPNVLEVALREAQEESGIMHIEPVSIDIFDIDIHFIPANKREKEHYHYDVRFLLQVKSDEEINQNHESQALKWFSKRKDLLPTDSRSITRMFDKWVSL
jgi:8-oxo-dGTP pyrophosphatase MutT (NUDIX family)